MKYRSKTFATFGKLSVFLLIATLVAGCTTNSLVVRYFYGRIDNNLNARILSMAEFTESQKAEIKQAVDEYALWHRRNELPRYAAFIDDLRNKVESNQIEFDVVMHNMEVVRDFAKTSFLQSPFVRSPDFMRNLDDSQVTQVEAHFDKQNEAFLERTEQYRSEDGMQKRLKRIVKNTRRFGINLNEEQKQIIDGGLRQYDNNPMERHLLWNRWEQEFIALLRQRNQPDFESKLTGHLRQYQDQMRIHSPERDLHNRKVSAQIIHDVVQNLDPKQRRILVAKLDETKRILLQISSS